LISLLWHPNPEAYLKSPPADIAPSSYMFLPSIYDWFDSTLDT